MNDKIKTAWHINGLLAVILVLLVGNFISNHQAKSAMAEGGGWETNGIIVNSSAGQQRLVVVDTKKQNIMIYHPRQGGAFALSGARNYKYDVQLEDTEEFKIPNDGWTYFQVKGKWEEMQPK